MVVREFLSTIDFYFDAYPIPSIIVAALGFVTIIFLLYKIAIRFVNTDTIPDKFITPILSDEKTKKKKPKSVKPKKNKPEHHAKDKEEHGDEVSEEFVSEPAQVLSEAAENILKPDGGPKEKSKKKRSSKETETTAVIHEIPVVESKVEEKTDSDAVHTVDTSSKKKKKNRRKGSPEVVFEEKIIETLKTKGLSDFDENLQQEQQVVVEEEVKIVITQEQTQEKPVEHKKSTKVPVNDLTLEKVLSRLVSVEDLESDYVNFLNKYVEQANVKEAKLNDNLNHVKKQNQDKDRLVNELNCKRQLLEERHQHEAYENTVRQKLAENGKLAGENKQLRSQIEQVQRVQTQSQSYQRETEELKAKLSSIHSSASQEINKKNQELAQLNTEIINYKNQVNQLNHHKTTFEDQNRQHSREVEALKQNEKRLLDEIQKSKETIVHVQNEFTRLEKTLQEKLQHEQLQQSSLVNEITSIEINRLEEEVRSYRAKYEEFEKVVNNSNATINNLRNENETLKRQTQELNSHASHIKEFEAKLNEKDQENEKLRQEIHVVKLKIEEVSKNSNDDAAIKKLQREYDNYLKQLQIAQAQLEEFDGIHNAQKTEISNLEERLKRIVHENDGLKEELLHAKTNEFQNHIEHEKENISHVPKLSHVTDDKLSAELEEQKQKNDELRQRNYKIVEEVRKTEQTTQKLISDLENKVLKSQTEIVHMVVSELKKLVPQGSKLSNLKNNASSEDLVKWINELAHVLSAQPVHPHQSQHHHQHQKATDHDTSVPELQERLKSYEKALASVNNHLHAIERVYATHDKTYKEKIAQLENQLNNRS